MPCQACECACLMGSITVHSLQNEKRRYCRTWRSRGASSWLPSCSRSAAPPSCSPVAWSQSSAHDPTCLSCQCSALKACCIAGHMACNVHLKLGAEACIAHRPAHTGTSGRALHAFTQTCEGLLFRAGAVDWGTGVVVAMSRRSPQKGVAATGNTAAASYIVDVLLECEPGLAPGERMVRL